MFVCFGFGVQGFGWFACRRYLVGMLVDSHGNRHPVDLSTDEPSPRIALKLNGFATSLDVVMPRVRVSCTLELTAVLVGAADATKGAPSRMAVGRAEIRLEPAQVVSRVDYPNQ